ncbi:2-polyprenyl-6-methoxyphenol hydroxylase [hydrothermal vent metagenome]|uniref:2-polyprenyl-6-methoxyphenol hydroxylase n=1 Tax=hydrothermal vent metagenome TaxID=652676 RepID=A0A3B0TTN0_9ZZZZ
MADNNLTCEVLVAGAGPAGLAAACLVARAGVSTIAVGPVAGAGDTRTTALFGGAMRTLAHLGADKALAGKGAPLQGLRIVDRLRRTDHPSSLHFPASEIGLEAFGTNYRNLDLLAALEGVGAHFPALTRIHGTIARYRHHGAGVAAELADGRHIRAQVVAACDGRDSPARDAAGIAATTWDYGQIALAFQIGHQIPHRNVSIEVHRPGGPLTFIPLPGDSSAVNWLVPPQDAEKLKALDDHGFVEALFEASGGALGRFFEPGARVGFPIGGLLVDTLAKNRTVLIGEAAHVLPPIGAQGLNLGFRDAATFAGLAIDAVRNRGDAGHANVAAAYRAARARDVMTRRAATDLLNRSLLLGGGAMPHLRGLGLVLLASSAGARRKLMTEGMGIKDDRTVFAGEAASLLPEHGKQIEGELPLGHQDHHQWQGKQRQRGGD